MADPPSDTSTGNDTGVGPDRRSVTSTPRWMKAFGIILAILVLLFVIIHLTSNGFGVHTLPEGGH